MKRMELDGLTLAYDDEGDGIPMLCIHGYPLNRHIWQPQCEGLAESARIIAPDLRNHGDSSSDGFNNGQGMMHSMDLMAEDLARLLDAMDIRQPIVVNGMSMGGYVAFAFYRRYASQVRGMILTASRARADMDTEKENRRKAIQLAEEHGVEPIAKGMLQRLISPITLNSKPELVSDIRAIMLSSSEVGIIGDLKGMMEREDSIALLPKINIPVLILMGKDDQIIPLEEAQAMYDMLPEARLEVIGSAGHLLNMEQPELYNRIVREYIRSLQ